MSKPSPITWFVILSLIAVGLALGLPPDPHVLKQLHATSIAYKGAVALLLVPYVLIWYTGFFTYDKLQKYSSRLKDTQDGLAFRKITFGMGTLAFSLVLPTIISLVLGSIATFHQSFSAAATIIDNYLALFPALLAFLLLYNGARLLIRTTNGLAKMDIRWHAPWFFLLCVLFSHFAIQNHYHSHPYHLPLWLLVLTVIVPYLYAWMLGLLSANNLWWYAKTVHGLLYQRAIKQFAQGIFVAIAGSIAIQFVNVTIAQRVNKSLGVVLLVDYGLLIIVSAGLILMAVGTKKLTRIEEV